jgi:hypothetical protein
MDCQNSLEEAKSSMSVPAFLVAAEKFNISNIYALANLLPDCVEEYSMITSTIEDELEYYLSNILDDSDK